MRVSQTQEKRLKKLSEAFKPGPDWVITAMFSDGRTKQMSAKQYARVKLENPKDVCVIDRKVTGRLDELQAYLDMVRDLAMQSDDTEEDILII